MYAQDNFSLTFEGWGAVRRRPGLVQVGEGLREDTRADPEALRLEGVRAGEREV